MTKASYGSDEKNIAIYVYGYSNITWNSPQPGFSENIGNNVTLNCSANNNGTGLGIDNHTTSFYARNETGYIFSLGLNFTDPDGYAIMIWDTTGYQNGTYYPICNVTDETGIYYYASANNSSNSTIQLNESAVTGILNVILNTPPDNTIVPRYRNFTINATVICTDGDCGTVTATAQYNSTGLYPDTAISTAVGASPFYTYSSNPDTTTLNQDESYTFIWHVNSTGSFNSAYKINVKFTATGANPNNTENSTVIIGKVLILNVSFPSDIVSFGALEPDLVSVKLPATGNGNPSQYVVTLDNKSNDADGIWIKSTNMTHITLAASNSLGNNNRIPVYNTFWNKTGAATDTALSYTYGSIQPGAVAGWFTNLNFFIDMPGGKLPGQYNGTITIMANASY